MSVNMFILLSELFFSSLIEGKNYARKKKENEKSGKEERPK